MGARYVFGVYYGVLYIQYESIATSWSSSYPLSVSPSVATICVCPRITIVFLLLSTRYGSVPNISASHSSIFLISKTHGVPPMFHIVSLCEFYSIALPIGHICASSSSRLLVYLFLLSRRSRPPTRSRKFSVSRSSFGRANTFSLSPPHLIFRDQVGSTCSRTR